MSRAEPPFKRKGIQRILAIAACLCLAVPNARALDVKTQETLLYQEIFDQNFYYEGTNFLHLERLYNKLLGRNMRATNVNVFGEIPDSSFFKNRHFLKKLTASELERGYSENEGPDTNKALTITKGKFTGLHPGFFVTDSRGDKYLIKFDPVDYLELTSAAEVIASRLYHAIGYNVPQYTIAHIEPERLVPGPEARILDDSGFKKELTKQKLDEYLLFIPLDQKGRYRVSASKILSGEYKGNFFFKGRRKGDPDDVHDHKHRREIRALQVFASWINNYDVRESNTLDMVINENGREVLKHYIIDFNSALGAAAEGPKPPMFSHEYMVDFGESLKAFLTLGWWEKPWQKRLKVAESRPEQSPAVGYFDNNRFDPGKFKTQLPFFAFKDVTRADGFWAAKIIMSFTDNDIRAMVQAGEYTRQEDADYVAKTLIERRDIIGRHWFDRSNPLDDFQLSSGKLNFKDLAVTYGFYPDSTSIYHVDVIGKTGNKGKQMESFETRQPVITVEPGWFSGRDGVDLLIRTIRPGSQSGPSPYVLVTLSASGIEGIAHED